MRRSSIVGYLTGLMAAFFWGIHSVIIRHLTEEGVSPFLIAGLRLYIGTMVIFLLISLDHFVHNINEKKVPLKLNIYFWIAALSLSINFLLFQLGLKFTLASDANFIQNFSPVVVLLITSVFMIHRVKEVAPNERFWMRVFQIILVGSIGASMVLVNDVNDNFIPNHVKFFGDMVEVVGMIFFAVFLMAGSEFIRTQRAGLSLRITMLTLGVASIPVSFFMPFPDLQKLTLNQWGFIIFIAVFSTGFAYWFWNIASRNLNIIPLSLNLIYIGIITVLTETMFLRLSLDWKFLIGGAMMVFASVAAEIVNSKAQKYLRYNKMRYGEK